MKRFVDLSTAHPGESYMLCIYGKPRMAYDFHFSSGDVMTVYDEKKAAHLQSLTMQCAAVFLFTAVDCYDDEMRLFKAPVDLLWVLRNVQKAGASFGGEAGDKAMLSVVPGVSKFLVKVTDKYVLDKEKAEADRMSLMDLAPPPADVSVVRAAIAANVAPPRMALKPPVSVSGKEYVSGRLSGEDLADYLAAFVYEVSISADSDLADCASRIIVEMNNSEHATPFNERMKRLAK
jgi:hypothetical protein